MAGKVAATLGKTIGMLVGTGAILLILFWLMGAFSDNAAPGDAQQVLPKLGPGV